MTKGRFLALGMAAAICMSGGSALAEGNVDNGEKIFRTKCKACHTIEPGKHKVGPTLFGVYGRPAGTAEGYTKYKGLKKVDFTWHEEELMEYLEDPKKYVRKHGAKTTAMTFKLKKEDDREDVISFLKTVK